MTSYQYSPLNEDLNEIRVLTLQPGDFSADIHVFIQEVALSLESPPIYEALSYVWGTTDNRVDIRIGPSGNDRLAITQNLAEALPYLRYKNETRTLWIDAICINQQDLSERSSQVKLMGDVYRLADRVVVWLGIEKDNSARVLKMLSDLSSEIKVDYENHTILPASSDSTPHWSDTSSLIPYSGDEIYDIGAILHRPWFSRLWVWQEIRLARENSIIICGSDTIPWQSLRQAVFCLAFKSWASNIPSPDADKLDARLKNILDISISIGYISLGDIIRRTAACNSSDPRDRIYAVLSLLHESDKDINIEPDYTKTTTQVYQDVVLRHIEYHGNLKILTYCELRENRPAEMPTWVPNWAVADTAISLSFPEIGNACGYSVAKVQYNGISVLSAAGVVSTTVSTAEEIFFQRDWKRAAEDIQRLAPPNIKHSLYVAGGSLIDAFCSTICVNSFHNVHRPQPAGFPQFEHSRKFVLDVLQSKDQFLTYVRGGDEGKYLGLVRSFCDKRSFIMTEEGYIGLAPKATKLGDQICVLFGCDVPLVLRPTSAFQYQVVGECYVHGLMDGEAFLGPLPDNYQRIYWYDQKLGYPRWGFMDKQTGNTQYHDPRMEKDEQILVDGKEYLLPDGSLVPQVTVDMLKRRGVQVQDFDLI